MKRQIYTAPVLIVHGRVAALTSKEDPFVRDSMLSEDEWAGSNVPGAAGEASG